MIERLKLQCLSHLHITTHGVPDLSEKNKMLQNLHTIMVSQWYTSQNGTQKSVPLLVTVTFHALHPNDSNPDLIFTYRIRPQCRKNLSNLSSFLGTWSI